MVPEEYLKLASSHMQKHTCTDTCTHADYNKNTSRDYEMMNLCIVLICYRSWYEINL